VGEFGQKIPVFVNEPDDRRSKNARPTAAGSVKKSVKKSVF